MLDRQVRLGTHPNGFSAELVEPSPDLMTSLHSFTQTPNASKTTRYPNPVSPTLPKPCPLTQIDAPTKNSSAPNPSVIWAFEDRLDIRAIHELDVLGLLIGEGKIGAVARLGEDRVPPIELVAMGRGAASRLAKSGLVTVGSRKEKKLWDKECLCCRRGPIRCGSVDTTNTVFRTHMMTSSTNDLGLGT